MQISFDGLFSNNLQKILCKTCAFRFLMSFMAFQKGHSGHSGSVHEYSGS